MKQNIKIGLGILAGILLTLMVFYFMGKQEDNKKLEMLGINKEQAEEIKNDLKTLSDNLKSDELTNEEINLFENYGLKKQNGLYYIKDGRSGFYENIIHFKKLDGKWYWSILFGPRTDINEEKYNNPNKGYDGYIMQTDNAKKISEKLREFSK